MRLRKHYSHHLRRYLMAPPTLTAWTHPCPLLALISISWLWPNPVINEHVIVSTIGCHPPAQSSSSLSCQNPALSSSVIDHVYLSEACLLQSCLTLPTLCSSDHNCLLVKLNWSIPPPVTGSVCGRITGPVLQTFVDLVGSVTTWVKLNLPARSLIGNRG